MPYPLHRPIRNYQDATEALPMIAQWLPQFDGPNGELGDRLVEIVIFRACQQWHELKVGKPRSPMFGPTVVTDFSEPMLLAPGIRFRNATPGDARREQPNERGARFFAGASCLNLLGSMDAAHVFRQEFLDRFPPWPTLPLWQAPDEALASLLTPSHRLRRDAGLLDMHTRPATTSTRARRL